MDEFDKGKMEIEMDDKEDADDSLVTMVDVLQEQEAFEENANAVLGASDEKHCTFLKGYVKRQALYACLTCCPDSKTDETKRAAVCLACSLACHENHELIELYTKRNFRCDCGTPKLPSLCQFAPQERELNNDNIYNQNFCGLYCECHRPYPDPEFPTNDEMIQCVICEDWWHSTHLNAKVPSNDQYSEMICKLCMAKNDFLHEYTIYSVKGNDLNDTDENIDVETALNGIEARNSVDKMNDSAPNVGKALSEGDVLDVKAKLDSTLKDDLEIKIPDSATADNNVLSKDGGPVVETALDATVLEMPQSEMLDLATLQDESLSKDDVHDAETNSSSVRNNPESQMVELATNNDEDLSKDDVPDTTDISLEDSLNHSTDNTEESNEDTCILFKRNMDSISGDPAHEESKFDDTIISTPMHTAEIEKVSDGNNLTGDEMIKTNGIQLAAETKDETEVSTEAANSNGNENRQDLHKNEQVSNEQNDFNFELEADDKPETSMQEESSSKDSCNDTGSVTGNENNNFTDDVSPATLVFPSGESASKTDELIGMQETDKHGEDISVDDLLADTGVTNDSEPDKATEAILGVQEIKSSILSEGKEIDSEDKRTCAEKTDEVTDINMVCSEVKNDSKKIPETTNEKIDDPEEKTKSNVINDKEHTSERFSNLDSCLEDVSEAVEAELLNEEQPEMENERTRGSTVEQVTHDIAVDNAIISNEEESYATNKESSENKNSLTDIENDITDDEKNITENMDVDKPYEDAPDARNNGSKGSRDVEVSKNMIDSDSKNESSIENEQGINMINSTYNVNAEQTTESDNIKIVSSYKTDKEQTDEKEAKNVLVQEIDCNKENENSILEPKFEKCKRKLSEIDDICTKKQKMDGGKEACSRPRVGAPRTKGSTFWPCSWRQRLCSCLECVSMYRLKDVLFLLDMEDTVTAYEVLGKGKNAPSQYEKGLEALSSLGHVQQINAITQYNNMKEKLLDFLKGFKDNRQVVREEDIKEFFAGMKPQRESDGVYFCR